MLHDQNPILEIVTKHPWLAFGLIGACIFGLLINSFVSPAPQLPAQTQQAFREQGQQYQSALQKAASGAFLTEFAESARRAQEIAVALRQRQQAEQTAEASQPEVQPTTEPEPEPEVEQQTPIPLPQPTQPLPSSQTAGLGKKAEVVPDMLNHLGSGFYDTDCSPSSWAAYKNCQHWGVDVIVPPNTETEIHAPFDGTFLRYFTQPAGSAEEGIAFIYTLNDGIEMYMGHLTNVDLNRQSGSPVRAGEVIGTTQDHNSHTHIQLRDYTINTGDPYDRLRDFLEYWKNHS